MQTTTARTAFFARHPFQTAGFHIVAAAIASALYWSVQAVELPPVDANLDSWAVQRVADRPGLPPLETRSPRSGTLSGDLASTTLALMKTQVASAPVVVNATEAPRARAVDTDNQVYATVFTAADGSRQEFAAHFRPADTLSLIHISEPTRPY